MKCNYNILIVIIIIVGLITYINRPTENFNNLDEYKKSRKPQKFTVGPIEQEELNKECNNSIKNGSQIKKMKNVSCDKQNISNNNENVIYNRYNCNNMNNKDLHANVNKNSWCQYTDNNPIIQPAKNIEKPYNSYESLNSIVTKPNPVGFDSVVNNYPFEKNNINKELKNNIDNLNNKLNIVNTNDKVNAVNSYYLYSNIN
jgi:hypothetical protein